MHLGIAGLYQPKWSRFIHDEWCRNLLINRPDIAPEALRRTVDLMNAALPDANVTGFAGLINGLVYPTLTIGMSLLRQSERRLKLSLR